MKTKMRGLTLAAVLLTASGSNLTHADDSAYFNYDDDVAAVGDLPGYEEDAYFADSASAAEASRKAAPRNTQTTAARSSSPRVAYDSAPAPMPGEYQSVSYNALQPTAYSEHAGQWNGGYGSVGCGAEAYGGGCDGGCGGSCGASCGVDSCGSGYDGGCDGGCGGRCGGGCHSIGSMMRRGHGSWATMEALLWWPQVRDSIPLVTNAPAGTQSSLTGAGTTVFGGQRNNGAGGLDGGLSGGFRADFGKWISDDIGVGGRFWWVNDNDTSYAQAGDANGTGIAIGVPLFNTTTGAIANIGEAALVINGDSAGGERYTGSIAAQETLELMGAEAYGRFRMGRGRGVSLDLLGGYTHFNIDDNLSILANTTKLLPALDVDAGNSFSYADLFDTNNRFNGGQVGFESIMSRGRWTARSLTKVHLGNMNQTVRIAGGGARTIPNVPNNIVTPYGNGIFTNAGNIGTYQRDVFAFAPEANFKLSYQFRTNIALSVGYTFMYWDNVALASSQIDRNVDSSVLRTSNAPAGRQAFSITDTSLYVQGVDLGVVLDF